MVSFPSAGMGAYSTQGISRAGLNPAAAPFQASLNVGQGSINPPQAFPPQQAFPAPGTPAPPPGWQQVSSYSFGPPLSGGLPPSGLPPSAAAPAQAGGALSNWSVSNATPQSPQDQMIINRALQLLGEIPEMPGDDAYFRHMGLNSPFKTGMEALQLIRGRGIRVEFGDMGDGPAHAQWINNENLMMINQRTRDAIYRALQQGRIGEASNLIDACTAAIFHEAGHAKDGDGISSLQEEGECMTKNTHADRYFSLVHPFYAQASNEPIIADGVGKYTKLLFDYDPFKRGYINRMDSKYGDLPLFSPNHPVPGPRGFDGQQPLPLTYRIAQQIDANNVARGLMPASPSLGQVPPGLPPAPASVPLVALPDFNMGSGAIPSQANPFALTTPPLQALASQATPGQQFSAAA